MSVGVAAGMLPTPARHLLGRCRYRARVSSHTRSRYSGLISRPAQAIPANCMQGDKVASASRSKTPSPLCAASDGSSQTRSAAAPGSSGIHRGWRLDWPSRRVLGLFQSPAQPHAPAVARLSSTSARTRQLGQGPVGPGPLHSTVSIPGPLTWITMPSRLLICLILPSHLVSLAYAECFRIPSALLPRPNAYFGVRPLALCSSNHGSSTSSASPARLPHLPGCTATFSAQQMPLPVGDHAPPQ